MKKAYVASILFLSLFSCRKDRQQNNPPASATASQDVYKVNVYRQLKSAEILAAAFVNSRPDLGILMTFNEKGEITNKKEVPGASYCFSKWNIHGNIRYSYIVNDITAK